MPFRWHRSTTSLKTTSHEPFFPPMLFWPGCRTSLNRRKEALPFTFSLRADGGAGFCLPVCVEESGGTMGCSSTRSLDDFGTTNCFTISMLSVRAKASRVLSRRDTAVDPAIILYTLLLCVSFARPNCRMVLGDWCACTALVYARPNRRILLCDWCLHGTSARHFYRVLCCC